jgi:hypothetical protein
MNMAALGGSNTMRNIPDVAMLAAPEIFLICNNGEWVEVGGTSAAAPLWAGFVALANQQAAANKQPPVGFLNPAIYALGNGSKYVGGLHDIVTGSNGYAALPGYDLATGWGTPAGQPLINDLSPVASAPSFGLSATPASVSVPIGSSASSSIQVAANNGFAGAVMLSAKGLPSGLTAVFGPLSGGASQLTLTASNGCLCGTYAISVQGVSGSLSASVGMNVHVAATPSFTLSSTPATVSVIQGGGATSSISVTAKGGFTGKVALSTTGLPQGVAATFSPLSAGGDSTMTITAASRAAVGTSTVTVTGTSGTVYATTTVSLTVKPAPSFALGVSPASLSVMQGTTGSSTVTVTPLNGFTGAVSLAISGLPPGVTASFSPVSASSTSKLTLSASASATVTTVTATIKGLAGSLSATAGLSLTIIPAPSFSIKSSASNVNVPVGGSGKATISVVPAAGFNGAVALTTAGLPTGVTASFSPSPTGTSSTLTLTAASSKTPGTWQIMIKGTSGNLSEAVTITVTAGSAH